MTKPEKAQIILQEVDAEYSIPTYLEDDVRTAIVKALVIIEKKGIIASTAKEKIIFREIDEAYTIPTYMAVYATRGILRAIKIITEKEAQSEAKTT